MIKKIEPTNDVCIKFTDEELAELKLETGTKFTIEALDNGSIQLTPFAKMEIDLSELSRDVLEQLIINSCEQDKSVNDVISDIFKLLIKDYDSEKQ
jgi:hypothetical protein